MARKKLIGVIANDDLLGQWRYRCRGVLSCHNDEAHKVVRTAKLANHSCDFPGLVTTLRVASHGAPKRRQTFKSKPSRKQLGLKKGTTREPTRRKPTDQQGTPHFFS